jgi:glycosyltransferase involved in cell wall biosynthesis
MAFKINNQVVNKKLIHTVPHGISSTTFKPIAHTDPAFIEFRKKLTQGKEYNFILLYNSRNIQRKRTSNIILAYRQFCDSLTPEEASKILLVLHCEIALDAGTNLVAVKESLCPNYNILFSPGKLSPTDLNLLYNCADVVVCASSSEGFGLSTAESVMAGTPIIATVTGGLQDQMGFVDDTGNPLKFTGDWGSNSDGKYKKCGNWAYPIWPATRMVQGSIPTPYIFDEIAKFEDFAEGFMYWYMTPHKTRKQYGKEGREWALGAGGINAKNMGEQFVNCMEFVFNNWVKPKAFGVYSVKDHVGNTMTRGKLGFEIPKIDRNKIQTRIDAM